MMQREKSRSTLDVVRQRQRNLTLNPNRCMRSRANQADCQAAGPEEVTAEEIWSLQREFNGLLNRATDAASVAHILIDAIDALNAASPHNSL